ncbi:MAG: rhomboid protease GluP [Verrucomicrobiales bacterium]
METILDEETTDPESLAMLGSYDSRSAAEEHGLVVVAMQMACWILSPSKADSGYRIAVRPTDQARALAEIAAYEEDARDAEQSPGRPLPSFENGHWFAFAYALVLILCFIHQGRDTNFEERYLANNHSIIDDGKTYLAGSALLLHGSVFHIASNICSGILFGVFVAGSIGPKLGWSLIVLSGAAGNLINAHHYYPALHRSLGASTAVFGAIGILTGFGLIAAFLSPKSAPWARAIIPIAGGVGLLGWLGLGDSGNVDVMAHVFGFAAGIPLGFVAGWIRILRYSEAAATQSGD